MGFTDTVADGSIVSRNSLSEVNEWLILEYIHGHTQSLQELMPGNIPSFAFPHCRVIAGSPRVEDLIDLFGRHHELPYFSFGVILDRIDDEKVEKFAVKIPGAGC